MRQRSAAAVAELKVCAESVPSTVLILSAGVGAGHHACAEGLRDELQSVAPELRVALVNGVGSSGGAARLLLERCLRLQLMYWPRAYSLSYAICVRWRPGRAIATRALHLGTRRRLRALIKSERPGIVVSTYPGLTTVLGIMRQRAQLNVPVCAMVTDIAGLHFWTHAGVDLHLTCYEESLPEIARITDGLVARSARPPLAATHWRRRDRRSARTALGLAADAPVILISGGGWGVGDLGGAITAALEVAEVRVIVVCGKNDRAYRRFSNAYADEPRVQILGHTTSMADLLGAASILVHSTGGMTCLEAAAHGCPVIAYGFALGHMRENVAMMVRCGMIEEARSGPELTRKLQAAIASPRPPEPYVPDREPASAAILELLSGSAAEDSPASLSAGRTLLARGHAGPSSEARTPAAL
jgi:processive 1,2-diacylglycerol beta-glucosyltransferase